MDMGMRGPIGETGDPGLPGRCGGPSLPCLEECPHGWITNSHAGIRGAWGAASETELLEHLIYWLDHCKKPCVRDEAGNAYCGVDSNVVEQTLTSLKRYHWLLTQPLGQQLGDVYRDGGKAAQGPKGDY